MKTKIFQLAGLLIFTSVIFSCDYIEHPYTVPGPNGCTVSEPTFIPRTNPVRKVLVEDFTGHKCGVCPNAHIVVDNLISQYNDRVVAVALHSPKNPGLTAPDDDFTYDFRTEVANEVDNYFGVSTIGIPNGMINRKNFGSGEVITHTQWEDKTSSELSLSPQMDIQIKPFYDPTTKSICAFGFVEALEDMNSNYKLVMWITEDEIINWQKFYGNNPEEIPDYEHNHVLRGALTNIWGVPVANGEPMKDNDSFIDGYSISIDGTDWKVDHLNVVAFVYDVSTYEVIQAEQVKVIP